MKTIFINRFFYPDHSATSQMLSALAFHLADEGREITVITSRLKYDSEHLLVPMETIGNVVIHRVWTSRFGRHFLPGRAIDYLTFYIAAMWKLVSLVQRDDIVVVKTDPPLLSVPASYISRLFRAKQVNWLQDLFPEIAIQLKVKGFNGFIGRMLQKSRDNSLARSAMTVVIGNNMLSLLEARNPSLTLTMIPNWADENSIRPMQHTRLRNEWQLAEKFVVGYSGNLGRAHEIDTLLKTIDALKDKENIRFLFIGGGALTAGLKAHADDRLCFKPYQSRDQLADSLAVPDVHLVILRPELEGLVLPSKLYGILAAGKPVLFIGHRHSEIAQLLEQHQAGIAIETGDHAALQREILRLATHPQLVKNLGKNARSLFDQGYSKTIACRRWSAMLDKL